MPKMAYRTKLMDVVYQQLHRIARSYLRKERSDHTLQPTALVHESYLKLFGNSEVQLADRAHFFAVVSAGDAANSGGSRPSPGCRRPSGRRL